MSQGKRHRTEYNSETSFFQFLWGVAALVALLTLCAGVPSSQILFPIRENPSTGIWTCFRGNGMICSCPFPLPFYICSLILSSRLLRELSWSQHMPLLRRVGVGQLERRAQITTRIGGGSERSDLFCFR